MDRKIVCAMAFGLCLGGCVSSETLGYIMDQYKGIPVMEFAAPDGAMYRVFDKPSMNKLMITPSLGEAMSVGFARGATFGATGKPNWEPRMIEASKAFLTSTGRTCTIRGVTLLAEPQWEVAYDCGSAIAAPTAPAPRR